MDSSNDTEHLEDLFRPTPSVDHRLLREYVIREYKRGRVSKEEICDASEELLRVARHFGRQTGKPCPICESINLVYVGFAFGANLPAGGQVVAEIAVGDTLIRSKNFDLYKIEVCRDCLWNHLVQKYVVSGQ